MPFYLITTLLASIYSRDSYVGTPTDWGVVNTKVRPFPEESQEPVINGDAPIDGQNLSMKPNVNNPYTSVNYNIPYKNPIANGALNNETNNKPFNVNTNRNFGVPSPLNLPNNNNAGANNTFNPPAPALKNTTFTNPVDKNRIGDPGKKYLLADTANKNPAKEPLRSEKISYNLDDLRKQKQYKNNVSPQKLATGKELDFKNKVKVGFTSGEGESKTVLSKKAGVVCDEKYPFHCKPVFSKQAQHIKKLINNKKRPRYIPDTIDIKNNDLVNTMEFNLGTLPDFYKSNQETYNNLLKMISSKGLDDPNKLEGQKITGFPDPGYVIKTLEEGLTFHASVKKYLRTLLEKAKQLMSKAEDRLKEIADSLKRKMNDAEDLYINMIQSKSVSYQAEMKKQLLQLLEDTMADDAEFHDTKDWIIRMREGISYNV